MTLAEFKAWLREYSSDALECRDEYYPTLDEALECINLKLATVDDRQELINKYKNDLVPSPHTPESVIKSITG